MAAVVQEVARGSRCVYDGHDVGHSELHVPHTPS